MPRGPASFLQVAGTQLALPPYARADLAFTDRKTFPAVTVGLPFSYVASDPYIDVILNAFGVFTTDGNAGNRIVLCEIDDNLGGVLTQVPANATQAMSLIYSYNFTVSPSGAYGPVGTQFQAGIPPIALLPGYTLYLEASGKQATDKWTSVTIQYVRVPTGPSFASQTPPLQATPVLV